VLLSLFPEDEERTKCQAHGEHGDDCWVSDIRQDICQGAALCISDGTISNALDEKVLTTKRKKTVKGQ